MPAYKNQHFLAQRAMRKFGHADGRSIDLFNLRKRSVIRGVSIADQCSKPYFYVKNGTMEPSFTETENKGLNVFDQIETTGLLPSAGTQSHHDLIRYISFQEGMTLGAAQALQESQETLAKLLLEKSLKAKGDPNILLAHLADLKITFHNIPMENVFRSVVSTPLLTDLSLGVFQSSALQDFILGDDPIILTNNFLIVDGNPICGFASRGLIIISPIAPTHAVVLYDSEVYRLRTHRLSKEETIDSNIAQATRSYANFYFKEYEKITESCDFNFEFPCRTREVQQTKDGSGLLINSTKPAVTLGSALSRRFIVKHDVKRHIFKVGNQVVRNPELANIVRAIRTPEDFAAFMQAPHA